MDDIDIYPDGTLFYGDDFSDGQISEWYADEKEGYANLAAADDGGGDQPQAVGGGLGTSEDVGERGRKRGQKTRFSFSSPRFGPWAALTGEATRLLRGAGSAPARA